MDNPLICRQSQTISKCLTLLTTLFFLLVIIGGNQHSNVKGVQVHPNEVSFSLLGPANSEYSVGLYDKPLSCFRCGLGYGSCESFN